jgi:hypothetical protein
MALAHLAERLGRLPAQPQLDVCLFATALLGHGDGWEHWLARRAVPGLRCRLRFGARGGPVFCEAAQGPLVLCALVIRSAARDIIRHEGCAQELRRLFAVPPSLPLALPLCETPPSTPESPRKRKR